ncbi:hypothetical protein SHIRM173S_04585 [Streptomyces hirsutus]
MAGRIDIVSAERVRDELNKLILSAHPRKGLAPARRHRASPTRSCPNCRPSGWSATNTTDTRTSTTTHSSSWSRRWPWRSDGPDLTLRLAALLHGHRQARAPAASRSDGRVSFHHHEVVGAKMTKKRLIGPQVLQRAGEGAISRLVELHLRFHGYGTGEWTDSAVRRYVRDAGPLLDRLHKLTRSDCTTPEHVARPPPSRVRTTAWRNGSRSSTNSEELDAIRPDLDGNQIMEILGVRPGPAVGQAYKHLLELRLENGPMEYDAAVAALKEWWAGQQG